MRADARMLLAAALLCALAPALAACARAGEGPAPAAANGMGMGAGAVPIGPGVIAAARDATLSAPVFDRAAGAVALSRVQAPEDGWVVVRSSNASGGVLGAAPVRRGETRDVSVRMTAADGGTVLVSLLVDRGTRRVLDVDPAAPDRTLDKPVLVGGAPVERTLALPEWGAHADPHEVFLMVEDQPAGRMLSIAYLLVPAPSWVEVRLVEKGVPTRRLGVLARPAGEFHRFDVPVSGASPGDEVAVIVLADRGTPGVFEPAAGNPFAALDLPWVSAGTIASQRVRLR